MHRRTTSCLDDDVGRRLVLLCETRIESFPSKTSTAALVFGQVTSNTPLAIESLMPERGVIFSDGIEADFLEFNSGTKAQITTAERNGVLVV